VLDEPTIGLDPHQIREIRNLIRSLAGDHTVLLSSHILPEVAMTCSRVVVIHRGRIAADVPVDASAAGAGLEETFLRVTSADLSVGEEGVA
jgi:ABC-2 type transport system ATP-binding protein